MMKYARAAVGAGVELFYARVDPCDAGCPAAEERGLAVVFVHGFPELHVSWASQMRALARAGFVAVAPDMRGYGRSSAPAATEAYALEHLTGDLCGLLDSLGLEKAFFVGHDWGGAVVWAQVLHHPERCLGVASLNTPTSMYERMRPLWEAAGCKGPIEYLMTQPSENCGQLDYTVYFNIPEIPERELEADVRKTVHAFFRSQVSGDRQKDFDNMKVGMRTAKARKDNNRGVLHYCPPTLERDPLWSEQEMQEYIDAFTRNGFTAPLNWYRNTDANVAWDSKHKVYERKVKVPCLMVTAEHDVVLSPEASKGMDALFESLDRDHVVAGHWVQREAEADVNRILSAWISKRADQLSSSAPASKI